jgi:hypothetical protein
MDYVTMVLYAVLGLVGGVASVLMPPMVTDKPAIVQHVVLGAILGFVSYFVIESQTPASLGTPLSFVATFAAGYAAIDGIKVLVTGSTLTGTSAAPSAPTQPATPAQPTVTPIPLFPNTPGLTPLNVPLQQ